MPAIHATDLPRWMTRGAWKALYRLARVAHRESAKAWMDVSIFGQGMVEVNPNIPNYVRHIPLEEWMS